MKEVLLLTCLSGLKSFICLVSYSGEDLWNLNMKYFILFPFILKKRFNIRMMLQYLKIMFLSSLRML